MLICNVCKGERVVKVENKVKVCPKCEGNGSVLEGKKINKNILKG